MQLIINADDFGFSKSTNEAIFNLARKGIIKSTSVMVNMPYAGDLKNKGSILSNCGIGLHLNLTQGKPISKPHHISSLVNPDNGNFYSFNDLLKRIKRRKVKHDHCLTEIKAQYARLFELVNHNMVDHWDSHQGIHKYNPIFKSAIEIGKSFKIFGMRSHRHYFIDNNGEDIIKPTISNFRKFSIYRILKEFYFHYQSNYASKFFKLPTGNLGIENKKNIYAFRELLRMEDFPFNSTLEISCHIATRFDDLPKSDLTKDRLDEYLLLNSTEFADFIRSSRIKLVSFRNLS